jgi:DNA-binding NarL/FixJ family response regulator
MNAVSSAPASAQRRSLKRQVFVVEDHILMRRSIVEAVEREPDLAVCGQAEDAGEALTEILSLRPDLVLTDIQLKSSSGLDLIKTLRAQPSPIPVVATTMFNVNQNKRLARAAGAVGFVSKQDGPDRMVATIREVLKTGEGEEPQENT